MALTDVELWERGKIAAQCHEAFLAALADKDVEVVRVISYRGKGSEVLDQLSKSLPLGVNERVTYTMTVAQGPFIIIRSP